MTEAGQQIDAVLKSVPQFTLREANRVYPYANSSERNYFLDDLRKAASRINPSFEFLPLKGMSRSMLKS